MAPTFICKVLFFLSFLACIANAQTKVFDVRTFGAKANADISQALLAAWKEACASPTPSTVWIPKGTWSLKQAKLVGPNKASIELKVEGVLKAPLDPSQMPNKQGEWVTINYLDNFTLSGGGVFDGQGHEAWKRNDCHKNQNCVKLPLNLSFNFITNSTIRDVTTKDSKNFHVNVIGCYNVTFLRFTISAPGDSPNTDGIHIARSKLVNVTDSVIKTGDDCVSMGDGTEQVHIQNVICGPGHGISVGSLGKFTTEKDVVGIYVKNCTFLGTQNGVRIKTWPSAPATLQVTNLQFEDLIMTNVTYPIVIDQEYCPHNLCKLDTPSLVKISNVKIDKIKGTTNDPVAVTLICSRNKPCENVQVGNIDLTYDGRLGPITTKCSNVKPSLTGKQNPPLCVPASAAASKSA
ncbi:polygalacturonase-like [Primulina eburnea]|uniref:polygalacturonase-like n=1 Tax=Primulina eburnea TaxID=1245227 RepID=UPI003C6C901F